jgi:hypothetical protein
MDMSSGTPQLPPSASHPASRNALTQISNRDWMRFEITATSTKHSPKLFLTDNEKRYFPTPIALSWSRHSWLRNPAAPAQLLATVPVTAGQRCGSTRQLSDSPRKISNRHKTTFFLRARIRCNSQFLIATLAAHDFTRVSPSSAASVQRKFDNPSVPSHWQSPHPASKLFPAKIQLRSLTCPENPSSSPQPPP